MQNIEPRTADEHLLRRIRGEYLEMPGLRLTCEQAQRLWGLDAPTCTRLLERLVDARFLRRGADGRYGQIGDSSLPRRPLRMLHADIDIERSQRQPTRGIRSTG